MPQRQDGPSFDPTSSQSAQTATRAPKSTESTETRQVLMHRVISLNGAPDSAAAANKPKPAKNVERERDSDLSRTVHEWGIQRPGSTAPQLTESTESFESTELAVSTVSPAQSQPAHNLQASLEAQAHWATHSSISLEVFEETPLPPRILNANIEDAVTQQYDPATASRAMAFGAPSSDLASLDRALESARVLDDDHDFGVITHYQPTTTPAPSPAEPPARARPAQAQLHLSEELLPLQPQPQPPRMLLVPASIVWTVLTVFLLCVLALTGLIVAAVLRGQLF
jgi:hypothetical protein